MSLLIVSDLVKEFGKQRALNNVNLTLPQGCLFGLLGPNGAGKSTLIRIITNIILPDSGAVELAGISNNERYKYIGYMPEERGLYKKMKVGEQLLYLARLKGLSRKDAFNEVKYWMEKFEIASWWNKKIEELSKGMQQKIQFIATIVHKPKLIILDEPFSGLDPINTNLIKDEIADLRKNGATILFSTHRMEQVEEICEEIALINKGNIILSGSVLEAQNRYKENLYEVRWQTAAPNTDSFNPDATPFTIVKQTPQNWVINLNEHTNPNQALQWLVTQNVQIQSFNEVLPSLNEVFIKAVGQNNQIN